MMSPFDVMRLASRAVCRLSLALSVSGCAALSAALCAVLCNVAGMIYMPMSAARTVGVGM
eukprot:scaffold8462_cov110-Isochrysis_galbana.AAC.3